MQVSSGKGEYAAGWRGQFSRFSPGRSSRGRQCQLRKSHRTEQNFGQSRLHARQNLTVNRGAPIGMTGTKCAAHEQAHGTRSERREDTTGMRISCMSVLGMISVLALASSGVAGAAGLDTPNTLHHAKTTEPHLSKTHHASTHYGATHSARSASAHAPAHRTTASHTAGTHASTAHARTKAAPARLGAHSAATTTSRTKTRRVALTTRRRHRYYDASTPVPLPTATSLLTT